MLRQWFAASGIISTFISHAGLTVKECCPSQPCRVIVCHSRVIVCHSHVIVCHSRVIVSSGKFWQCRDDEFLATSASPWFLLLECAGHRPKSGRISICRGSYFLGGRADHHRLRGSRGQQVSLSLQRRRRTFLLSFWLLGVGDMVKPRRGAGGCSRCL